MGKKRGLVKEGPSEVKDNSERKGGEREARRGSSNRRGRGIIRGREGKNFLYLKYSLYVVRAQ